jgi:RNA polymerase sigma-70 factor (ECF subfamily)
VRNGSDDSDETLVAKLRSGDEAAFAHLVESMHGRLIALARTFTRSPALAEDIVQETWLAVIRGLPGFEERSTLRTWVYGILVRRARTLAARDARAGRVVSLPGDAEADSGEWEPGKGRQGLWEGRPAPWDVQDPATMLQMREALEVVERALAELPETQRQVVLLRDVEDLAPTDICNVLGISGTNQRVLLHRGRARIRQALDRHLRDGDTVPREPKSSSGPERAGERSPSWGAGS